MENTELLLRRAKQDVSEEVITKLPNFKAALKLCKDISGLNDQQVSQELGIDPAQWSRIWSGQAHFPPEKIPCLMDLCGNIVPLRWLALRYGYELRPLKSQTELENEALRAELTQIKIEFDAVKKFMQEIKG
jgi:hypothetical protein